MTYLKKSGKKKKKKLWRKLLGFMDTWLERFFVITNEGVGYMMKNHVYIKSMREFCYFPINFKVKLQKKEQIKLKF